MLNKLGKKISEEIELMGKFADEQVSFLVGVAKSLFGWTEWIKVEISKLMYRQRGRFSSGFVHVTMAVLAFLAITFSSKVESLIASDGTKATDNLMLLSARETSADTLISDLPKGEISEYRVQEGDTISSIADKFGVSVDTIVWENELKSVDSIKVGQILKILPVIGVNYKVRRGETVNSIAKKHGVDAQNVVDYPFNSFTNDETFGLIAGQELMIPDGIKPREVATKAYVAQRVAPIPGVVGEGNFMWPTSGRISQKYSWYHRAVDIANKDGPVIVASQSGTVTTVALNSGGYGNYVMVDHGNGYSTLYAHLRTGSISVGLGQKVNQGQALGTMGSTGRSTGVHLHFEIIGQNGKLNPLVLLK
jgi:murein DD-endopeptidase MepM/ murein hydrolase activator NlpD